MLSILKAIDINLDPDQMLELLSTHIQKITDSIENLSNIEEKWPILPSPQAPAKPEVNMKAYKTAYESLKVLLAPPEEGFKNLISIKKSVVSAREDLNAALQNKKYVGASACLEKAKKLKELLKKQKEEENIFIEMMLHKWRTAMLTFATDIDVKKQ